MRVAVIGGSTVSLVNFRGELLRAMAKNGHEVLALGPEDDSDVREALAAMRVAFAPVPLRRAGLNPLRDLSALMWLARTLRAFRADTVLSYTVKPVVYGSLAARLAGVPQRAALITGVGSALGATGGWSWLSLLVRALYRLALREVQTVFFQNPDDEALFRRLHLVDDRHRVYRVNGSGVDLVRFAPAPLPEGPFTFLMIARLIRDKGVQEYVEAARRVRRAHPEVRFQMLGPLDPNPTAVTAVQLDAWKREGVVEYLGSTSDVRPFIAQANVCVLPSYAEGTPRTLLEAMAMGRPILTTDAPGCRETVFQCENGILVPARDAYALAAGMTALVDAPADVIKGMAVAGRRLAEERFDVHSVNRTILEALRLSASDGTPGTPGVRTSPRGSFHEQVTH